MATSAKQRDIEDEFGQPFWEVVHGFAQDGYSAGATGKILGYSPTAFRRLAARHGKLGWFPYGQECAMAKDARASRKGKATDAMRAACKKASANNPTYIRITYEGITATMAEHARRRGIPVKTARNRYYRKGGAWDYVFSLSSHVIVSKKSDHPWR